MRYRDECMQLVPYVVTVYYCYLFLAQLRTKSLAALVCIFFIMSQLNTQCR